MGTTLSSYRTIWNEPGGYGELLRVYDRAGEPCRRCGGPIRRLVQGGRSTYFCPACQPPAATEPGSGRRRAGGGPRGAPGGAYLRTFHGPVVFLALSIARQRIAP